MKMTNVLAFVASLSSIALGEDVYTKTLTVPLQLFDGTIRYACTATPLDPDQYIVAVEPSVKNGSIHHLSLALCDDRYEESDYWSCFDPVRVCKGKKDAIIALDSYAIPWNLPRDIAIHSGDNKKYLVLQVHGYLHADNSVSQEGNATINVRITKQRRKYDHALHVNINGGYISTTPGLFKSESACNWPHTISAPIYSFGIHTHKHGVAVSGYIIRNGTWIEVGRGHPMYPKVIYDISHLKLEVKPGDIIAARCTYDNFDGKPIQFGFGEESEMCGFYFHFGVRHEVLKDRRVTVCNMESPGFRWEDYFKNIPITASDTSGDTVQNRYLMENGISRIVY